MRNAQTYIRSVDQVIAFDICLVYKLQVMRVRVLSADRQELKLGTLYDPGVESRLGRTVWVGEIWLGNDRS